MVERTVVEKTVVERTVVERTSGGKHLSRDQGPPLTLESDVGRSKVIF